MKLKKLEIQGFKSFADKTEIIFLDGVTTIVGPNGSGKSNISDAIKWVLGEQSVKNLRGSKMEDVIFAGTQARKKVGFAEVSMYLDNSDFSLPVEFKEVVVTRRVYRTGESNYLINGTECRLKDVQELFMDTGVGKDGYSIISQGKIDEILSSKSDERRHIFEEASGIVKYRTRKEEATRKLNNTDINLSRVNDILTEIENTIGPLEKKAEIAKKYLAYKDELKNYDIRIFISAIDKNNENLANLDDIISTFEEDIKLELKNKDNLESDKIKLKERLEEVTLKIEETQKKFFKLENEIQIENAKIDVSNSKIENANENIARFEKESIEDEEKIELLKEEIKKRLEKRESMSQSKIKFENELKEKQQKLNEIVSKLDEEGTKIEELKLKIDEKNDEKYDLREKISLYQGIIETNNLQIEDKKKYLEKNISIKDNVQNERNEIVSKLNEQTNTLADIEKNIDEYLEKSNDAFNLVNEKSSLDNKLNSELMTLKSKYTYLTNLESENEGYYKSVKSALDFAKNNNIKNVYGTVASVISTNEKYEYAIEIALGGYLQNIIVEDEYTAKNVISYLKENKLGRATFLPLTSVRKVNSDIKSKFSKLPGVIGYAAELVDFDKKYERAINLALNNTLIVDNIDSAINISKKTNNTVKIVTLSGELISSTGSMTGGENVKKSAGLIGRQEKINRLKENIEKKEQERKDILQKLNVLKEKSNEIINTLNDLKSKKESLNIEIVTLKTKLESIDKELQKAENIKIDASNEIENLQKMIKEYDEKILNNNNEIAKIDDFISQKQVDIDDYTRLNKEKSKEIDYLNEDVMNLKISLSSFDESVASIDEMKEKIEQDINNFNLSIEKKKESIKSLNETITNEQENIKNVLDSISKNSENKQNYQKVIDDLKNTKIECTEKQENLDEKINNSLKNQEKLKEEKSKIENRRIKYDIEIENLKNKMWDDYELTITGAKKILETYENNEEISDKELNKKAEAVRKKIKDLGEVNVSAIEEYKELKQRYDFILSQKKDLEETKTKLENLINNMTSIMKQQFSKQFKIITENFNTTFKELFGGGKAELRLSDESNVLESGIEIEVQPPGKKLQSMMLLSGGERALTAIALLFAILKIKSPPFCILDEIEAALDDVNVARFADYIKKYSSNTQFIVITHRKGTMEVASSVYGVTMQEYGISKIVSMKLK